MTDDTSSNINSPKIHCNDSSPAMSGTRINSGNPDYQFEMRYNGSPITCAVGASPFYFSFSSGNQTLNITPMQLVLIKTGSSGSSASITYPNFQFCKREGSQSNSDTGCWRGQNNGLSRYTPTSSFATVVVNSAPVITSNGAVSVNENQTAVTTVTATDGDGDTITYSISGGVDQSFFSINSSTGVLTFNSPPDFENPQDNNADNEYRVRVTASDGNGGSIEQTIAVTVLDVAENSAPVITSAATANAAENQTAVATVTATDGDGDTLSYSITGGADSAKFSINSSTGVLTFVAAPDFEAPTDAGANNVYDVQVTVSDGNGGTDVQDIAVTVTDVAENVAPVISSNGGGATASVNAAENQTAVTTVTATDGDGDTLSYSITGGADSAKFAVNSSTGVLTFISAPDFENPTDTGANNVYDVQVTVSDGNGGSDVQDIAVTVTDVLDEPPLACNANTGTNWVLPDYFVEINSAATGISGICILGCSVSNGANVTDNNVSNFATVQLGIGVAANGTIAVRNSTTISYPAGTFAGFVVQDGAGGLLSVDLLGGLTVQTYLDGALQESASAGSLLNLALFGGTPEKRTIGFNTTLPFDEVRVRASSLAALAVDLDVYNGLLAPASCLSDTTPPIPSISAPATHDGSTAFNVTVDFGEDVTGFDGNDLTVANGTVNSMTGGPQSYTVQITPDGSNGDITIDIAAAAAQDGANNDSSAASQQTVT
ncbi:MAG: cadherin domain-containing protein, partial [Caldilineaceae bacterium]